jgi:hypothetical protein
MASFMEILCHLNITEGDANELCSAMWGGQADPLCTLCQLAQEKTLHLIANCEYSNQVWRKMASWANFQLPSLQHVHRLLTWWEKMKHAHTQQQPQDQHLQLIIYTTWGIWKERCRRVFDTKSVRPAELCSVIRNDILTYRSVDLTEGE